MFRLNAVLITDFEVPKNFPRLGYIRYFIGIEIKVGSNWSITRI